MTLNVIIKLTPGFSAFGTYLAASNFDPCLGPLKKYISGDSGSIIQEIRQYLTLYLLFRKTTRCADLVVTDEHETQTIENQNDTKFFLVLCHQIFFYFFLTTTIERHLNHNKSI